MLYLLDVNEIMSKDFHERSKILYERLEKSHCRTEKHEYKYLISNRIILK